LKVLHAKIGELALENDFLEGALSKAGLLSANDRTHDLPFYRQAKVLNLSRGAIYYKPRPVLPEDLALAALQRRFASHDRKAF
jgi:putative transposase